MGKPEHHVETRVSLTLKKTRGWVQKRRGADRDSEKKRTN